MKRRLSMFLCVAMLLSMTPVRAHASTGENTTKSVAEVDATSLWGTDTDAESVVTPKETVYDPAMAGTKIASGTCGGNLAWTLGSDGVLVISGTGAMGSYDSDTIPWHSYQSDITGVVIGSGVTSISKYAFYDCSGLSSIKIPDGVTSIGEYAFWGCSSLSSIKIPNGVTRIGNDAFGYCSSLSSITIPESVTRIGDYAFSSCSNLKTAGPIGGGYGYEFGWTNSIPVNAFYGCSSLTSIALPGGVTSIGECAFFGCSSLTSIALPSGVTSIGVSAFEGCSSLTSIALPSGVTSIGNYLFSECSSLNSITIPDGVTSIGVGAFKGCSNLTEVTFCGDAPSIGYSGFYGVTATVRYCCYSYWTANVMQNYGGTLTWVSYDPCEYSHDYESATTAPSCTEQGYTTHICANCGDSYVVSYEDALGHTEVIDEAQEPDYACATGLTEGSHCSICGIVFVAQEVVPAVANHTIKDGTCEVCGIKCKVDGSCGKNVNWAFFSDDTLYIYGSGAMTDYTDYDSKSPWASYGARIQKIVICQGVTRIGNYSFFGCSSLNSITIPESVTSIGHDAFYGCSNLKTAGAIGGGYDYEFGWTNSIPVNAFYGCSSLTNIVLPGGVTSIGEYVFYGCSSLSSINIPDGVTHIGGGAFKECRSLSSIALPEGVTSISNSAFYGCSSLSSINIPDGVTRIGNRAFYGCSNLSSINIPESVTRIDGYAFNFCSSLSSITIPDNVTSIGVYAFKGCSSLSSINIPDGVTGIDIYAFSDCSCLKSITIPDSVTYIGNYAFKGCSSLSSINIPDGVTSIGNSVFRSCISLTNITIPESVTRIGRYTFYRCSSLTEVTFCGDAPSIDVCAFSGCSGLKEVTFCGDAPSITSYAFEDVTATGYYPRYNDTWTTDVMRNYGGMMTWVSYDPCKNGHDYRSVTTAPTCTERGYTTYTCSNCGDSYTDQIVEVLGHDMGQWVPDGVGIERRDCSRCDHYETRKAKLIAPTVKSSNVSSTGKIKLSWDSVEGAVEYNVYRATSKNGEYTLIKETTGTAMTNTGAITGKTYYYYVVAVDEDGTFSEKSNTVYRTCDLPRPVVTAGNDASTGKIKLTWDAIDGAVGYKVYRSTSKNGTYKLMKTTTGTSYTNTSAEAGTAYYYEVVAVHANSAANSASSEVKSRTCDLACPEITLTNVASSGKIKVSWEKVAGAKEYKVYRATSKTGTYKLMRTTTGTSYTNTSAEAGTAYYYKVVAVHDNSAANSAYSEAKSRTCDLARPVVSVKLNTSGKPVVSWKAVDGAAKYKVYAYNSNGDLIKSTSVTGTKMTHSAAAKGKTYSYRVVAVHSNTAANSAKSTAVSIKSK